MKNKFSKIHIKLGLFIMVVATFGLITNCNPDDTQTVTNFNTLTLAEEFNGTELNTTLFGFDIGNGEEQGIPGWGNGELQYYTNRTDNVVVEDGVLKIIAREDFPAEGFRYSSGRIITKASFTQKYGRFEARIKLPWGQGIWPAFWMLGDDNNGMDVWPDIGEIDIMENRGQEPTIIAGSIHGPGYSAGDSITKEYELEDSRFDADFHVFGIEWGENYINYYVDDVLYNQLTPDSLGEEDPDLDQNDWVFNDREFYIILNIAVGGSYVGNPSPDTVFPQVMEVDYIRVYSAD